VARPKKHWPMVEASRDEDSTGVFSLRVCANPLDRLVLDQRAGDLVTRTLPCQSREAGCRGAFPYEPLDVRRAIAVVPVPRVVGAIPFVGALWIRRPGRWTHPECLPGHGSGVQGKADVCARRAHSYGVVWTEDRRW
jgi:hypothetical protein